MINKTITKMIDNWEKYEYNSNGKPIYILRIVKKVLY